MPKLRAALAACLLLLSGSVQAIDLMPDYASIELEHMSHATQHFGPKQTNYGSELLNFSLEWSKGDSGPYLILSEGIDLDPCRYGACGEIAGPGEEFQARLGYRFRLG